MEALLELRDHLMMEAIRRTQRRNQTQSDALRRTRTHSDALRRTQTLLRPHLRMGRALGLQVRDREIIFLKLRPARARLRLRLGACCLRLGAFDAQPLCLRRTLVQLNTALVQLASQPLFACGGLVQLAGCALHLHSEALEWQSEWQSEAIRGNQRGN